MIIPIVFEKLSRFHDVPFNTKVYNDIIEYVLSNLSETCIKSEVEITVSKNNQKLFQ